MRFAAWLLLLLILAPSWGAAQTPIQRAEQAYSQGQYDAALRFYQEGCSPAPDWSCHQSIGMCYYMLNRWDEAIASFQRSVAAGGTAVTHLSLGQTYSAKGDFAEAVRSLRRSIELDPSSPVAWSWLAAACYSRGWYSEALQSAETGIKKGPPPEGIQVMRETMTLAYAALGRYPESYAIAGQQKLTHMSVNESADGLKVFGVRPRGPADLAGIRPDDVLISLGGQRIAGYADLTRVIEAAAFGSTLPVELRRAGKIEKTAVVVGITPNLAVQAAAARASSSSVASVDRGRAAIRIAQIRLKPQAVSAGAKFDVEVEYSAADPGAADGAPIPVQFSYTVATGEKTILTEPAATVQVPSGKSALRVLHLTAARRPGTFVIRINLRSRGAATEESFEFQTR